MYKNNCFCRWCGKCYRPLKMLERDGFCCNAHKQAHYRAYKRYVTFERDSNQLQPGR